MQMQPRLAPCCVSHSLRTRQVTEARVRIRQSCLFMLIRSTPSSTNSNSSGPIACRESWLVQLVCLRYTHLKPPRHLYIVANKRCLLLPVRLCDQYLARERTGLSTPVAADDFEPRLLYFISGCCCFCGRSHCLTCGRCKLHADAADRSLLFVTRRDGKSI